MTLQLRHRHYITSTLLFQQKAPLHTRWRLCNNHHYLAASYSQRLCIATLISASLPSPPATLLSTTIRPPWQLKTGSFAESAHRQYYLISIELFQMKSKGVSHSPGLFSVLVQCVGSLFMIHMLPVWKFCCRLTEPPLFSGSSPKRKLLEMGSFVVFSEAGVVQVTNYIVQTHFCCCKYANLVLQCEV